MIFVENVRGGFILDKVYTFNIHPENYDLARPVYPNELYQDIYKKCNLNSESKILEIGMGTGQATYPFLQLGADITSVEIGCNLAGFAADKYKNFNNLKIINKDFMECDLKGQKFNLIFSATAFHWLPTPEKYERIEALLNNDGYLALFWNRPFVSDKNDPSNVVSSKVYSKYTPSGNTFKPFDSSDMNKMIDELSTNGFYVLFNKIYTRTRVLKTSEYISLLNTYSDHLSLPECIRKSFEYDMYNAIESVGGKINIYDSIDLYISKIQKSRNNAKFYIINNN